MAKYLHIFNMGLIITEECNLRCEHCMRGSYSNKVMSDDIIKTTLDQIDSIGTLSLCGGEPLLAMPIMEKILTKIVDNRILVEQLGITTNGLIYNEEFLKLLDYFYAYLKKIPFNEEEENLIALSISYDKYHLKEIKRLKLLRNYLENVKLYKESKYFYGMNKLWTKPFCEGSAENLKPNATLPLRPMQTYMTYIDSNGEYNLNSVCNIGPLVTVNANGTITECDASIEHQETLYNYGNVLTERIEDVMKSKSIIVDNPKKMENLVEKERIRYLTYKK